MIGAILKVGKFAWDNRRAIGRAYHHFVRHRVALDALIDYAEESPKHPQNREKTEEKEKTKPTGGGSP